MKTINLTKEQYKSLEPWEKEITNAYKNNFVHMTSENFNKVAAIYKEIFGEQLNPSQMRCNTCRLNALRKLGEAYTRYGQKKQKPRKQKLEKEDEAQ